VIWRVEVFFFIEASLVKALMKIERPVVSTLPSVLLWQAHFLDICCFSTIGLHKKQVYFYHIPFIFLHFSEIQSLFK
jgi:hypothetical protein